MPALTIGSVGETRWCRLPGIRGHGNDGLGAATAAPLCCLLRLDDSKAVWEVVRTRIHAAFFACWIHEIEDRIFREIAWTTHSPLYLMILTRSAKTSSRDTSALSAMSFLAKEGTSSGSPIIVPNGLDYNGPALGIGASAGTSMSTRMRSAPPWMRRTEPPGR